MSGFDTWSAIVGVLAKAANAVDAGNLEAWLDCFAEDCSYHVLSRENYERGLPLTLFQCDNKDMMRDRVLSLREANVVNIHRDQHVVGLPEIEPVEGESGVYRVRSGYAVYQTDQDGISRLFAVGVYHDRIRVADARALLTQRRAIVDTFAIQNMLSTPV